VVHHVSDITEIKTKLGKLTPKRELTLVDKSGHSCLLTLWGKQAENWQAMDNPVIATKGLKLGDFGGTLLPLRNESSIHVS
jgi:replication factor A1